MLSEEPAPDRAASAADWLLTGRCWAVKGRTVARGCGPCYLAAAVVRVSSRLQPGMERMETVNREWDHKVRVPEGVTAEC